MNRRDALRFSIVAAAIPLAIVTPVEASQLQLKTQDALLVMERETRNTLLDLFDNAEYTDMSFPFKEKWELIDEVHAVMWFEWKSLADKLKWENHEVLQR